MNFEHKYLKYKNKYSKLKKMIGGDNKIEFQLDIEQYFKFEGKDTLTSKSYVFVLENVNNFVAMKSILNNFIKFKKNDNIDDMILKYIKYDFTETHTEPYQKYVWNYEIPYDQEVASQLNFNQFSDFGKNESNTNDIDFDLNILSHPVPIVRSIGFDYESIDLNVLEDVKKLINNICKIFSIEAPNALIQHIINSIFIHNKK